MLKATILSWPLSFERSKLKMKYIFLINPRSGSGKGINVWQKISAYLATTSISYRAVISKQAGQPRNLAKNIANKQLHNSCLVVIGGDGTLHEAVTGLLEARTTKKLPFAYILAGTGNDFARGYGISFQPLIAFQQIINARQARLINLGHFYNRQNNSSGIFLNNLGIGFDAAIVKHTVDSRLKSFLNKHHLGTLSYALKTIKVLVHQPPFHVQVSDGQHKYDFSQAFLVVASNHPYIGGGIKIAADQRIDEEQLELAIIEKKQWLPFLWAIVMFASGNLIHSQAAHLFRGRQLTYKAAPRQYGQVDGEVLSKSTFDLELSCLAYPMWQQSRTK